MRAFAGLVRAAGADPPALITGERDPQVLAEMAKARMRPKISQLVQALTGNFGEHHAFCVGYICNASTNSPR